MNFGKLVYAALISFIITWFSGGVYLLYALATGTATIGDVIQGCLVCWLIFTVVIYQLQRLFDDLNNDAKKPRDRDDENHPDKRS